MLVKLLFLARTVQGLHPGHKKAFTCIVSR